MKQKKGGQITTTKIDQYSNNVFVCVFVYFVSKASNQSLHFLGKKKDYIPSANNNNKIHFAVVFFIREKKKLKTKKQNNSF